MATLTTLSLVDSDGNAFSLDTNKVIYAVPDANAKAILTFETAEGETLTKTLTVSTATLQGYSTNILFKVNIIDTDGNEVDNITFNNKRVITLLEDDGDCEMQYNVNADYTQKFTVRASAATVNTAVKTTFAVTQDDDTAYYLNSLLCGDITPLDETETELVSAVVVAAGTSHNVGDTLPLVGGTYTTQGVLAVTHIKVVTAVIKNAAGAGYVTGDTVSLTTGTGTQAIFTVTAVAGAVTAIALTTAGDYTVRPTLGAGVATTAVTGIGTGLTVAAIAADFGVKTVTVNTEGIYQTVPTNPVAQGTSSGAGINATFTLTWGEGTVTGAKIMYNDTNNSTFTPKNVQQTVAQIATAINNL